MSTNAVEKTEDEIQKYFEYKSGLVGLYPSKGRVP